MISNYFNNTLTVKIDNQAPDKYGEFTTSDISGVPARFIKRFQILQTAPETNIEIEGEIWIEPHMSIDPDKIIQFQLGSVTYEAVRYDVVQRFNTIDHIKFLVARVA